MELRPRARANGDSGLPHTLPHEQFVQPEDFPRFRELGVVSGLQLFWAEAGSDTIEIIKPYLDPELTKSVMQQSWLPETIARPEPPPPPEAAK